ncbi:hypothetical protein BGX38DRAFT_1183619 [Terfezia claveryi]|nr:hypothetical protein BGX38DRAFT_1183619 [Terfezia claveryi]
MSPTIVLSLLHCYVALFMRTNVLIMTLVIWYIRTDRCLSTQLMSIYPICMSVITVDASITYLTMLTAQNSKVKGVELVHWP